MKKSFKDKLFPVYVTQKELFVLRDALESVLRHFGYREGYGEPCDVVRKLLNERLRRANELMNRRIEEG